MTRIIFDVKFQVNQNLYFILKIHIISVSLKDLSNMDLCSDVLCLLLLLLLSRFSRVQLCATP